MMLPPHLTSEFGRDSAVVKAVCRMRVAVTGVALPSYSTKASAHSAWPRDQSPYRYSIE
jgi:hypothetical protein